MENWAPFIVKLLTMLSIIGVEVFLFIKIKNQKLRLFTLVFTSICIIGDILLGLPLDIKNKLYIGGAFFALAHIFYAVILFLTIKKEKLKLINPFFFIGIGILILTVILCDVLAVTIPDKKPSTLRIFLITLYIIFVGSNLTMILSYSYNKKGTCFFMGIGMIVFYITDVWIFLSALNINSTFQPYVWYLYPLGQALIALFNSELNFNYKDPKKLN